MGQTVLATRLAPGAGDTAAAPAHRHPSAVADDPVPPLELRLLGRFELTVDGREIRPTRAAQALIAVLALRARIRTREAVAADIWPDGDGPATTTALRQALWALRSAFASADVPLERYLAIDPEVIGFHPCAPLELDVARFETALRGRGADPETAIALYRGDLGECVPMECLAVERERLSDAYEDALAVIAERRLLTGDVVGAREAAETLLNRDSLREEAHAVLLGVHGRTGSRAQVIRQYRRLTELLERELGVEALPETVAAYHAALAETLTRSRVRAAAIAFRSQLIAADRPVGAPRGSGLGRPASVAES